MKVATQRQRERARKVRSGVAWDCGYTGSQLHKSPAVHGIAAVHEVAAAQESSRLGGSRGVRFAVVHVYLGVTGRKAGGSCQEGEMMM